MIRAGGLQGELALARPRRKGSETTRGNKPLAFVESESPCLLEQKKKIPSQKSW